MADEFPLEVDANVRYASPRGDLPHPEDTDSVFSDDYNSELTSLRSSIVDYRYENGRRYHAYRAGSYWGPNDEKAQDHLDFGHHVYNLVLGGHLYLAPIPTDVQKVLDVGTGTGIWAMEFADLHPSSTVVGTDLSPIQPTWVPPNVQFEVDDCTDEWLYGDDAFDFVHVRGLYGCVSNWDVFYKQALRSLKPGGWIEQVEQSVVPKSDDGTTAGTVFEEWGKVSLEAGDAFGKSLRIVDESKDRMTKAGFVDVVERRFKLPIGGWASDPRMKQLGLYNRLLWEEGIEGWCMYLLTAILKWSREEVEVYLSRMRKGLRSPRIHPYHECTVVYGRKAPKETHTNQ
ncbi:class I SAM-dependent methyltransferase [Aspergillus mulundensis]|uniref:SAM dependent methyltransferase n=1 Tax=Aspergillus mulundensis TaxID=1810919 RepID=A0A3D8RFS6_9EURO|nr:SAM dependent methyltransferase [Aspergillus mulundensis]RDW72724.1 SAM dependent methyltransferase [Aspergillus mulundensis]